MNPPMRPTPDATPRDPSTAPTIGQGSPAVPTLASRSIAAAVRTVSGLTLVSRFAGLARDVVIVRIFGDTALASSFRAAYAIPNLFRRLFGEGALSAAFLPEYTFLSRDDPKRADQLASLIVRLVLLATGALTFLGEIAFLVGLLVRRDNAELSMSLRLMMLMLPMMPAVCLTAVLGGMLQVHGRFAPPAAAPIILNLFQIAVGVLFFTGTLTDQATLAYAIAVAALLASAAQVAWSLFALRGKVRWVGLFDLVKEPARNVKDRFIPACLGLGTLQLNTFLDMLIAMWPIWIGPTMLGRTVTLDQNSNAILSFTQTVYQFPLGVFGIAVATAVFPLLSRTADKPDEFLDVLRRGVRLSLFIGLPASVGLWLVRDDIVSTLFTGSRDHGGFSADGLARAGVVLSGFAPAIWAYSLNHVFTRAFYARGDTKTPMTLAACIVVLNLVLNLVLIWPLREAGLAYSTATTAILQCLVLGWLLRHRHGVHALNRQTIHAITRIVLAAAIMGAAVYFTDRLLPRTGTGLHRAWVLFTLCAVGGITYALAAMLLRAPEWRWLLHRGTGERVTISE